MNRIEGKYNHHGQTQTMSPALFWLMAGVILCLMELFLPTAFVEATLGISALLVSVFALFIPQISIQIGLWLVFSVLTVLVLRRFLPKRTPYTLAASTEARTITAIPPGEMGRVLYEGNSWQARCEDYQTEIAIHQQVIVVGRQGNTLLVIPEHALNA